MKVVSFFVLGINIAFAQQTIPFITERTNNVEVQSMNTVSKKPAQHNSLKSMPIWGAGSAVGSNEGEFNGGLSGWSTTSIYDYTGAPGNAFWTHSYSGISEGAYWGTADPIASPSLNNGVAIFDSDYMDNGGVEGAFGTGTSPSPHKGEIISPLIDLSGYTDESLSVNFYCKWRSFQVDSFLVGLSVDNGLNWSTKNIGDILPSSFNHTEGWANCIFSDLTAGITDLTQCRLKFVFEGNYYYAMLDDVSIALAPTHDLTIAVESPNGSGLSSTFEQVQITNNRHYLLSQMNSNHITFGANVKNFGAEIVLPSDSAKLHLQIQKNNGGTWVSVHDQNVEIDSVYTDKGRLVYDTLNGTAWLQEGDFRTRYTTSLSSDLNATNDTVYHYFSINGSCVSKVGIDSLGFPSHTRPIFPGGVDFTLFEYGSMFEFSNAENTNLRIDSIIFKYYVPSAYNGPTNQSIFVGIYQFEDGGPSGSLNGYIDANGVELIQIGVGVFEISDIGTTVGIGQYGVGSVTEIVNPSTAEPIENLSNGHYLISLLFAPYLTGGPDTFNSQTSIWSAASEEKNYAMNVGASINFDQEVVCQPSPVRVIDGSGSGDWNCYGFGADIVPSLGVYFACQSTTKNVIQNACNSFTWIDGNTYDSDTTVTLFIPQGASNGCDSILILDLTVVDVDVSIEYNNDIIQANATNAEYQWVDCNNGNYPIDGANEQSFSPTSNGDYAVIVTQNNCSDTSSCVNVSNVSVNQLTNNVSLYPNPTDDYVKIQFNNIKNRSVSIISSTGIKLYACENNTLEMSISLKEFPKGIYFVEIQEEEKKVIKLLKL